MLKPSSKKGNDQPIIQLLPNMVTIAAICAGMSSIRFAFQGDFETAVRLVLLACVLDGVDGRLARLLRCQSSVGAELDSLADFVNFGVAPGMILYAWALQDFRGAGWIAVLGYAVCCVLRLARFNVSTKEETSGASGEFFVGVPAPAGAVLVMLPMYVSFSFTEMSLLPPIVLSAYIFIIGLLMISRIPTYSFKNTAIPRADAKFLILGIVLVAAAILIYLWTTLILVTVAYIGGVLWAFYGSRKALKK